MFHSKLILNLARVACVLAFFVVTVGAFTRLSDAGLGCPDWPGCYGKIIVPNTEHGTNLANEAYPDRPLEHGKAWKEMFHRYIAGTLGLLILAICLISFIKKMNGSFRILTTSLVFLVAFQALLGMWTVTLLLKPVIVMGHLLGGFAVFSLLYWIMLRQQALGRSLVYQNDPALKPWAVIGIIVLIMQISLGGWTSSNYAALACPDFPTCQGVYWPNMDFKEAFILWRGLGVDYEGGVLDGPARTAIHFSHRIGAIITFIILFSVAIRSFLSTGAGKTTGMAIMLLLFTQISLGIANVYYHLPLSVAVAHNGVAALLLLSLITLLHQSKALRI